MCAQARVLHAVVSRERFDSERHFLLMDYRQ